MPPKSAQVVIAPQFDLRQVFFVERHVKAYRSATNLAAPDLFLRTGRAVDLQGDPLTAIWTVNFNFVLQAHAQASLNCQRDIQLSAR